MKAKTSSPKAQAGRHLCSLLLAACCLLPSCLEDEGQVRELRQLREKLVLAEKKAAELAEAAAEAQNQAPAAPSVPVSDDSGTAALKRQLSELESKHEALQKELQAAKSMASAASDTSSKPADAGQFKDFVKGIERDLMEQASTLQQQLQEAAPTVAIEGITVKRIASGFSSEIVFNVADGSGQTRPYAFPVQAMLDGKWRVPSVADVQRNLASATQAVPVRPAAPTYTQAPAPAPAPAAPQAAQAPASPMSAQETVTIRWDSANPNAARLAAPQAPQTTAAVPPPAPAPTRPAQPTAPAAPRVPAPVMPVTQDVQIRFE